MFRTTIAAALLIVGTGLAHAGAILSPVSVTGNTLGTFGGSTANIINQSGIPAFASGVTDFDTYMAGSPTHAVFGGSNAWSSVEDVVTGDLDFDLGGLFQIGKVALWNQAAASQDINGFTILTADNAGFIGATDVGSFNASDANRIGQVFDIADSIGRYVRLRITSNHGSARFTTLGEFAVDVSDAPPPVPLPASLPLLGGALVAAAGLRRMRRR